MYAHTFCTSKYSILQIKGSGDKSYVVVSFVFLHLFCPQVYFFFVSNFFLLQVVRWGRSVYANIQKFIQFQLTVNVAALVINVVAAVSSGDVPLNAVEVIYIYFYELQNSYMSELK